MTGVLNHNKDLNIHLNQMNLVETSNIACPGSDKLLIVNCQQDY